MDLRKLASILRRKAPVVNLLGDVSEEIFGHVPCDGMRFDLSDDRGGLWTRIVRRGQSPERPSLGSAARLKTRETFEVMEEEGVHQVVCPLGLGDPATGRWTLRRRSGPFSDAEIEAIKAIADVLSLGMRARPFDPPPSQRRFGEEDGPLV
jgi:hypothetical protein